MTKPRISLDLIRAGRIVRNCKYCGKTYKYGAWLHRHEQRHWWNEVATPETKKAIIEFEKKCESIVLFGFKDKPGSCGGIQNFIST